MDASGKLHPGVLAGNLHQLGNYEQCLDIKETKTDNRTIRGQYCSVFLVPREPESSFLPSLLDTRTVSSKK